MPRSSHGGDPRAPWVRDERPTLRATLLSVAGILAVLGILFLGGDLLQRFIAYRQAREPARRALLSWREPALDIARDTYHGLPHWARRSRLTRMDLPIYDLRITAKKMHRLQATIDQVAAKGVAIGIPTDYVAAEFQRGERWIPVDVKLRGWTKNHFSKRMASLRIKFPKDRLMDGKRRINLVNPYDKGLMADITTNYELRRHGILTWEDAFVVLRINGHVSGIYQEIEQFDRALIDRSGRPEGFIFSGFGQLFGGEGPGYAEARAAILRVAACFEAPAGERPQWTHAELAEYFDVDRLAWAAAFTAALGSSHAWAGDNLRLYWNPAYGQFEPIPWDYSFRALSPLANPDGEAELGPFGMTCLGIPGFRRERDRRLWTVLTTRIEPMIANAEALFTELTPALAADVRHPTLRRDEAYHASYLNALRGNREQLMRLLAADDLRGRYWRGSGGRCIVEAENYGKAFAVVESVVIGSAAGGPRAVALDSPVTVDGIWKGEPGRAYFAFACPPKAEPLRLAARSGVRGTELEDEICHLVAGRGAPPAIPAPPPEAGLELPAVNVRLHGHTITMGPGEVRLLQTLELPRGYDVVFQAGLDLRLAAGVSLLAYGNLTARGRPGQPIRIGGLEGDPAWGALAFQGRRGAPVTIICEEIHFTGGSGCANARTRFTAPLAVHGGEVMIRNSTFSASRAEDGINLKHCRIELDDSIFTDAASDAVDLDFCRGAVIGNRVRSAAGDGIDASGARLLIAQNHISGCGDKGISIGEASWTTVRDNYIVHCYTGVALKDRSRAHLANLGLGHSEVGVALYEKKPTFGPCQGYQTQLAFYAVASPLLGDPSCRWDQAGSVRYYAGSLDLPATAIDLDAAEVDAARSPADLRRLLTMGGGVQDRCGIRAAARIKW